MITRQDIENEAAFIQKLIKAANPTGGDHTPTPWHKMPAEGCEMKAIDFYAGMLKSVGDEEAWSRRAISDGDGDGKVLAFFLRPQDRDLALYFANAHPPIIALLRQLADAFEFLARGDGGQGSTEAFCHQHAEMLRIYADIFCRLGKIAENEPEETNP